MGVFMGIITQIICSRNALTFQLILQLVDTK